MITPPRRAIAFLRWFCREDYIEEIEGDLTEIFRKRHAASPRLAKWQFVFSVVRYFRPAFFKSFMNVARPNSYVMFKSYFKIGWRNLLKNRGYSAINIGGLAIGMTVAMFIGLWVYDELSFNKYHKHHDDIGQVWNGITDQQTQKIEGVYSMQYPVGIVLENNYGQYFKHVLMAWHMGSHAVTSGAEKFTRTGLFIEDGVLEMLTLKMLRGSHESLKDPNSVVLSQSTATSIFGDEDPIDKILHIDGKYEVVVTGVYEDIPANNRFGEAQFFAPWSLWIQKNEWASRQEADWDNRPFNVFVQLQPNTTFEEVNAAISDLYIKNVPADFYKTIEKYKPFVQLIPMSTWHLYGEIENGRPSGGRITLVWLFGLIGIFVLVLACINFVNLSTARSESRSKEVGLRKAIGSGKFQLVFQFLSESLLMVMLAFVCCIGLLVAFHNQFNLLADKHIALPFGRPVFWVIVFSFIFSTGILAGIYPAFYLSSFRPVEVLKGVFRTDRFAASPRRILVVVQFTVSVVLMIGTAVVFQQIRFAMDRPAGYQRQSLISVPLNDPGYNGKLESLRAELMNTGVVAEVTSASSPLTAIWNVTGGYTWPGKDPNLDAEFVECNVSLDYGKTLRWEIVEGRDFSRDIPSDSSNAIVVNEAAVEYMGLKDPVGKMFTDVDEFGVPKWSREIVGVVKDIVMGSPFAPVKQAIYFYDPEMFFQMHIRIDESVAVADALPKIKGSFGKVVPSASFEYQFVDDQYAWKFAQEQRTGKLAAVFSVLAIFISCIGLLGLASFVAEQRTREIGIRKVMGASVMSLWKMLSRDFMVLVILSCLLAIPIAYYLMDQWLSTYEYRTGISWWIITATTVSSIAIALLTVSYQAIRAARMNPVKSLKME